MSKICCVFGAGEYPRKVVLPKKYDIIIASDGGYRKVRELGLTADFTVGDFDSLGYIPKGENITLLPREKDVTDMDAAVNAGLSHGCDTFCMYGALGGRLDHSIANIQLCARLSDMGVRGILFGQDCAVFTIIGGKNNCKKLSSVNFSENFSGIISVFPVGGKVLGVCERGLKYTVEEKDLGAFDSLGISNEFTGKRASISCSHGTLAVVLFDVDNAIKLLDETQ